MYKWSFLYFCLCLLPLVLLLDITDRSLAPSSLLLPHQSFVHINKILPESLLSRLSRTSPEPGQKTSVFYAQCVHISLLYALIRSSLSLSSPTLQSSPCSQHLPIWQMLQALNLCGTPLDSLTSAEERSPSTRIP